ncbi:rRNA maturation RNase YbeY [Acidaminobacterium chupaoyuni]
MGSLKINFLGEKPCRDREAEALMRKAARAAVKKVAPQWKASVDITLTDNEGIAAINGEYRGKPVATDVLSFPMLEMKNGVCEGDIVLETDPDTGCVPLGDMIISVEKARAQAEEFGHGFERECAYLTVHSILHLLGYDHVEAEEDRRLMRGLEEEIMQELGLLRETGENI